MIIYSALNKINGKRYIGKTTKSLEDRQSAHEYLALFAKFYFHSAIKKYGKENFEWSIIEVCENEEILKDREIYWIAFYKSFGPDGYNLTAGGEGTTGYIHSNETREKISLGNIGKKHTDTAKEKICIAAKNQIFSDETRKKLSIASSKYKCSEETKQKIRNSTKGRIHKPESIEKMRQTKIKQGLHPKTIEGVRKAMTGKTREEWLGSKEKADAMALKIKTTKLENYKKKREYIIIDEILLKELLTKNDFKLDKNISIHFNCSKHLLIKRLEDIGKLDEIKQWIIDQTYIKKFKQVEENDKIKLFSAAGLA